MTTSEFIEHANHSGQVLTAGVHWNPEACARLSRSGRGSRFHFRLHGFWHHCAPRGAVACHPSGLPVHGPAVCDRGAYAS
jgi:hypothetical protein